MKSEIAKKNSYPILVRGVCNGTHVGKSSYRKVHFRYQGQVYTALALNLFLNGNNLLVAIDTNDLESSEVLESRPMTGSSTDVGFIKPKSTTFQSRYRIKYKYVVNGKKYMDYRILEKGLKNYTKQNREKLVVRYDASKPWISILDFWPANVGSE